MEIKKIETIRLELPPAEIDRFIADYKRFLKADAVGVTEDINGFELFAIKWIKEIKGYEIR